VVRERLEARLGVTLPRSFRDYLLAIDGMNYGEWVDELEISFWNLARIEKEAGAPGDDSGLFVRDGRTFLTFADFLIHSHTYAIEITADAASGVYIEHTRPQPLRPCGETFEAFVDLYERGDRILYG
jgi:hypothetical protein